MSVTMYTPTADEVAAVAAAELRGWQWCLDSVRASLRDTPTMEGTLRS